jgi:hypothetical protein
MRTFLLRSAALLGTLVLLFAKSVYDVHELQGLPDSPDLHGLLARADWLATISLGMIVGIGLTSLLTLRSFDNQPRRVSLWGFLTVAVFVALLLALVFQHITGSPRWH